MAAYTTGTKKSPTTRAGGCHCKEEPELPCSCCKTSCFERPQYHCGHLLSSEDLTLQLRYDMEKNKLRNRTLFGCGVVCGLRLTCDPDCCGAIRISKGYAIDACGNDLVACDNERFNVMSRLREKQLIACPPPTPDPCTNKEVNTDDCPEKQCFYIVACYDEVEDVFETPFQASCDPKPAACVPTRIRERISFDVVTKAPGCGCSSDLLHPSLKVNLKGLEDGPLGDYLQQKQDEIGAIASGDKEMPADACEVLCNIVRLFRRQLGAAPAEYNCGMTDSVNKIKCPNAQSNTFAADMAAAMQELLNLIYQYSVELVLGKLAFDCCEPDDAGCVVLGAVYVENGKLIRVCNTPRQYVWSFTNFWKILELDLVNYAIGKMAHRRDSTACCPVFEFDAQTLHRRIAYSRTSMSDSVSSFPMALDALRSAAADGFNFANPENFAAGNIDEATLKKLDFQVRDGGTLDATASENLQRDVFAAFASHMLIRPTDQVLSYAVAGNKQQAQRVVMRDPAAAFAERSEATTAAGDNADVMKQIAELRASLAEAHLKLNAMTAAAGPANATTAATNATDATDATKATPKKEKP